jgi:hypothetical protein
VSISGSNFQSTTTSDNVDFNINPALVASANATSLGTTVPGGATTGRISVTTPYGQASSSSYFYVPPAGVSLSSIAITGQITAGGSAVTATLNTAGTNALYAFDSTTGQQISLGISNNTIGGGPLVYVYNPDGSQLASTQIVGSAGFIDTMTLAQPGAYTILVVSGSSTGSMTLTL